MGKASVKEEVESEGWLMEVVQWAQVVGLEEEEEEVVGPQEGVLVSTCMFLHHRKKTETPKSHHPWKGEQEVGLFSKRREWVSQVQGDLEILFRQIVP